jgi:predicted DNA-binding transcriptional regulator AlpA
MASKLPEPIMVSVTVAARLMGISRSNAYNLINAGQFPVPVRQAGTRILVNRRLLEAWCNGTDEQAEAS